MAMHGDEPGRGAGRVLRRFGVGRLIGLGVLVFCGFAFVVQNRTKVTVDFLFLDFTMRLWLLLLIIHAIGIGIGLFIPRLRRRN